MLNICLIGAGRIGAIHAEAVESEPLTNLHSVVDYLPKAAKILANTYNSQTISLEQAFNDATIDAYIIASSTETHTDMIKRCVKVGKPVFCEKPIDLDIKRAISCTEIVKASGIVCMLGFNRRFDPDIQTLKQKLDANLIGNMETLTILSRDARPPPLAFIASSGGLFYDMMIHDFDMACWLLPEPPTKIYVAASVIDKDVASCGDVDNASVILTTKSGIIVTIINGRQSAFGHDQRIEIFGQNGMLQMKNLLEDNIILSNKQGFTQARAKDFFLDRYAIAYRQELLHFIHSIQNNTKPSVGIEDGLRAIQIAEAANESLQSGRAVDLSQN